MCAFADEESGMPPVLLRGAVAVLTALAHNLGSWGMATRVECEYVKSQHTTRKLVQTKCAAATACAVSYGLFVDEVCERWRFVYSLLAHKSSSLDASDDLYQDIHVRVKRLAFWVTTLLTAVYAPCDVSCALWWLLLIVTVLPGPGLVTEAL